MAQSKRKPIFPGLPRLPGPPQFASPQLDRVIAQNPPPDADPQAAAQPQAQPAQPAKRNMFGGLGKAGTFLLSGTNGLDRQREQQAQAQMMQHVAAFRATLPPKDQLVFDLDPAGFIKNATTPRDVANDHQLVGRNTDGSYGAVFTPPPQPTKAADLIKIDRGGFVSIIDPTTMKEIQRLPKTPAPGTLRSGPQSASPNTPDDVDWDQ